MVDWGSLLQICLHEFPIKLFNMHTLCVFVYNGQKSAIFMYCSFLCLFLVGSEKCRPACPLEHVMSTAASHHTAGHKSGLHGHEVKEHASLAAQQVNPQPMIVHARSMDKESCVPVQLQLSCLSSSSPAPVLLPACPSPSKPHSSPAPVLLPVQSAPVQPCSSPPAHLPHPSSVLTPALFYFAQPSFLPARS
ncbi:hypothetical protein SKAU_G00186320 [Synaphobranchus kaupii]|uniref:Uncharacterized protein n=1 Tax=Synaphobranchus kaupii TaxID=118154 RepID=A0A9Q1IWT1_SYNKA|nr:hypothetical protein SKAU_G00186320 [Synaphobranchus kaupii]